MGGCSALNYSGVTQDMYNTLVQMAEQHGVTITGNSGTVSKSGFTGTYNYDPGRQTLKVQCTDKPFIIPCSLINSTIDKAIRSVVGGANNQLRFDHVVEGVLPDPSEAPNSVMLAGLLGRSDREGYLRVYSSPQLNHYLEVAEEDVLHTHPLDTALGGSLVWVRRDAKLQEVHTNPVQAQQGFLQGQLTDAFLGNAAPAPGHVPGHAGTVGAPAASGIVCISNLPPICLNGAPQTITTGFPVCITNINPICGAGVGAPAVSGIICVTNIPPLCAHGAGVQAPVTFTGVPRCTYPGSCC